jgi:membrane-anchored glycerophosphoryl diester phosphodiesterase (GDPDase)
VGKLMEHGEREEQTLVEKFFDAVKNVLITVFVVAIVLLMTPFVGIYVVLSIIISKKVVYPQFLMKNQENPLEDGKKL